MLVCRFVGILLVSVFSPRSRYAAPTFAVDTAGRANVVFGEAGGAVKNMLSGSLSLPPTSSIFAVVADAGTAQA